MIGGVERDLLVNLNRLRWRDAPEDCGPHKTL
ncbi:hypothetical protein FHS96_003906 [Sphingomonas zeicaulis]